MNDETQQYEWKGYTVSISMPKPESGSWWDVFLRGRWGAPAGARDAQRRAAIQMIFGDWASLFPDESKLPDDVQERLFMSGPAFWPLPTSGLQPPRQRIVGPLGEARR